MHDIHYLQTPAGLREMAGPAPALTPRERQIMLLCGAHRPLPVLIELFGDTVVRELHELAVRGLVQALRRVPDGLPPARAGVAVTAPGLAQSRLIEARDFATQAARALDTPEAEGLAAGHGAATTPEDVLVYLAAVIELLFRSGDLAQARRVGYQLAELLPREQVPGLIDCILNGPNPSLAAALYAHLLAGRDLPAADAGASAA